MIIQRNQKKVLALRIVVALITLAAGYAFHQVVDGIGALAINYDNIFPYKGSTTSDSLPTGSFRDFDVTVICLSNDRAVYLGRKFIGTLDDMHEVEQQLSRKFIKDEQRLAESQPADLEQPIKLISGDRTVYIKAFVGSSSSDISPLIQIAMDRSIQYCRDPGFAQIESGM